MNFKLAQFFLFLYFIRPQDWVQGLIGVNIVKPLILAWIAALVTRRERSPVAGLLSTPHDKVLLVYFAYVVWNAPDSQATFSGFLPLLAFYVLTVQSLTSWERVLGYLRFWNWMLLGIAAMAVASLYGLDLTGAANVTDQNAGRLSIGTWLCDNPNALAHTSVVAIPLSYYLFFWKHQFSGFIAFALSAVLAGACAYYTESKGSYLVGAGLVVLIYVIGRPWPVKLVVVAVAGTMGVSALSFLPRMEKMGNLRDDEGVQGRLMAWEMARHITTTTNTGVGWRQFVAMITWQGQTLPKATHSSYVQVGADLGIYGLFIYVAGLWTAARSLLAAQRLTREHVDEERCRRVALIMLAAYAVSSWMINREYHTEYFLLIAIATSIHRLCHAEQAALQAAAKEVEGAKEAEGVNNGSSAVTYKLSTRFQTGHPLPALVMNDSTEEAPADQPLWEDLGWLDFTVCACLTWAVLAIWDYVLANL